MCHCQAAARGHYDEAGRCLARGDSCVPAVYDNAVLFVRARLHGLAAPRGCRVPPNLVPFAQRAGILPGYRPRVDWAALLSAHMDAQSAARVAAAIHVPDRSAEDEHHARRRAALALPERCERRRPSHP